MQNISNSECDSGIEIHMQYVVQSPLGALWRWCSICQDISHESLPASLWHFLITVIHGSIMQFRDTIVLPCLFHCTGNKAELLVFPC